MRIDDPYVGCLVAKPRTYTVGGGGWQAIRGNKGPKGINQVKVIVNVATVNAVGIIKLIINTDDVFSPVLWIVRLKNRIKRLDRVRESGGHLRHLGIDGSNSSTIRSDALRRQDVGGDGAACWDTSRICRQLERHS